MKLAIFALGLSLSSGLVACTTTPPHSEASSAAQPASTDQEDLVDAYVQEWMEAHDFNGIVLVQKNADKHVIVDGVADHESGRPLTEDTVFQSGSIDKFFASIAVFALAEEGRLDIDAPISTYLPDYRRDTGDRLTLKHLMANRSGLPDTLGPIMGRLPMQLAQTPEASLADLGIDMSLAEAIEAYASGDLKFEPGESFDYVHTNWILVHRILEAVTGQPYAEILETHVFAPAGMTASGVFSLNLEADEAGTQDIAVGYDADDTYYTGDFPIPAMIGGATYTNASDLMKLFDALYGGRILNADFLERFSTITTDDENYAYGGRVGTYEDDPLQLYSMQSGSNGATNVVAIHEIGGEYTFIAMSNFAQSQDDMFALSRSVETLG